MIDKLVVSIFCTTYNHERYIRQCLEGFVMQKTDFLFEVLVHDDASTDHTADIVREYQKKYPDVIKPVFQTENQYSKGVKITTTFLLPLAKGKYFAFCEGDDFWSNPLKLQKQVTVLEKNIDCHMCVHKVGFVNEKGEPREGFFPVKEKESGILSSNDFLNLGYCHLNSMLVRSDDYRNYMNDEPDFKLVAPYGDRPLLLYFMSLGNNYYISDIMSFYRVCSIGSWTQRIMGSSDRNIRKNVFEKRLLMLEAFNKYTNGRFQHYCDKECLICQLRVARIIYSYKGVRHSKYKRSFFYLSLKDKCIFLYSMICFWSR